MMNKLKKFSVYIFYAFFAVCFSYLLFNIIFNNREYAYKKHTLIVYILAAVCLLTFIYSRLSKHESFFSKHYKPILVAFLCIMMIVQVSFGVLLRFKPDFDIDSIYQGAIDWVQTGTFTNYYDYYYRFPNNLGAMAFLHFFFSISYLLGIKDYFLVGVILNSLLSILTMLVVFLTFKRISGAKQAVFSLLLFAIYLPLYFIAPVFYTDSLSTLFPALFYYLYLIFKDTSGFKKICLICFWMGLTASIGMQVKFTVFIMIIAVTIDMFINLDWKKSILASAVIYSVILICFVAFNGYIYTYHLDKERAAQDNDPYVHWVMMGLKGTGGYNPEDYDFTRSFKDPIERRTANINEIKRRIANYGPDGMFKFLTQKGVRNFGDGTFGLDDFLADRPDRIFLHQLVLPEGKKYDLYRYLCEAVLFTLMLFMIFPALKYIFHKNNYSAKKKKDRKGQDNSINLAPMLAIFGIFIFLLAWESNKRYFSNFLPAIIISATLGIDCFYVLINRISASIRYSIGKTSRKTLEVK